MCRLTEVLPVYAMQVYRNKFIIQLKEPHIYVYEHHPDGTLWLVPSNFEVSAADAEQTAALVPSIIGRFPM